MKHCSLLLVLLLLGAIPGPAAPPVVRRASDHEHFRGMADASAGVMLGTNYFAAGSDEDNRIRTYQIDAPGMPVASVDCSEFLRVFGKNLETDLEGAARLGDRVFWIGSHGENRHGHPSPNRRRLFATLITTNEAGVPTVRPIGEPYERLLEDLGGDARYQRFGLGLAALRAPKAPGGLNIEGLCATPDGGLYIGFRNPIPRGQALIAPLLNPSEVIRGERGRFGPPILLRLGGNGIRDMGLWGGRYFILAGAFDPEHKFRLYQWVGPGYAPELLPTLEFSHLNPEALVFSEESSRFLILSDDGTRKVGGVESKSLPDPAQRRFRALWAEFPGHTPADAGGPKGISLSVPGGKQAAERPLPGPP